MNSSKYTFDEVVSQQGILGRFALKEIDKFIFIEEIIENKIYSFEEIFSMKILNSIQIAILNLIILLLAVINKMVFGDIKYAYILIATYYLIMMANMIKRSIESFWLVRGILWRNAYLRLFKEAYLHTKKMNYSKEVSAVFGIMHCITKYIKSLKSSFVDPNKNVVTLLEKKKAVKKIKLELSINIYNKLRYSIRKSILIRSGTLVIMLGIYSVFFIIIRSLIFNDLYKVTIMNMVFEPIKIILKELIEWRK